MSRRVGLIVLGVVICGICSILSETRADRTKAEQIGPPLNKPLVELEPRVGIYRVIGITKKGKYEGTAQIYRNDDAWKVYYSVYGNSPIGVGILKGNTLSVGWRMGEGRGVSVYRVNEDGSLYGCWTGGDGELYPERLEFLAEFKQ